MRLTAWNQSRYDDLRAEESRVMTALEQSRDKLHQTYESDRCDGDDDTARRYVVEAARHRTLTDELTTARQEISALEFVRPDRVRAHEQANREFRAYFAGESPEARPPEQCRIERGARYSAMPEHEGYEIRLHERRQAPRATSSSDDTAWDASLPEVPSGMLVERLLAYGGHLPAVWRFMTGNANPLKFRTFDHTGQTGEWLHPQATAVSDQDLDEPALVEFNGFTLGSKRILISRELVQDNDFDIRAYAESVATMRMGRSIATATMTGSGTGQPQGLTGIATAQTRTASATAVTWQELESLSRSLPLAYRQNMQTHDEVAMAWGTQSGSNQAGMGMTGYLVSDGLESAMRMFVDSEGRPLWRPSIMEGSPNRFGGWMYRVSADLGALTRNSFTALFGNFGYYGLRLVTGVQMYRFFDSETAKTNSVVCQAFMRCDGRAVGPIVSSKCEAFRVLQQKAS